MISKIIDNKWRQNKDGEGWGMIAKGIMHLIFYNFFISFFIYVVSSYYESPIILRGS